MFCFPDSADHYTRRNDILIFAHNNGLEENVHFKEVDFKITNETKCKVIQTGGGSIEKNVGEFKKLSLQYYKDHKGSRFPHSYYNLQENPACQWAGKLDSFFSSALSRKILVGYDPIIHAQLFGLEKSEYEQIITLPQVTFENLVILINPESRWVMVSAVTENTDPSSIELELRKIDSILKTLFIFVMNNECIAMIGVLVCTNINSFEDLQNYQTATKSTSNIKMSCVTKEELGSEKLLINWITKITTKIESDLQEKSNDLKKQSVEALETLTGTMMASMAQTSLYLPKMTYHIPSKITTILMSQRQIETVMDLSMWKIINAPFGGGKTLILAEIAKNLLKVLT